MVHPVAVQADDDKGLEESVAYHVVTSVKYLSATYHAMVAKEACIASGSHYLDLSTH
jgi:saccharopine dehydrogenase-like NADP-dependent oxidoreductase